MDAFTLFAYIYIIIASKKKKLHSALDDSNKKMYDDFIDLWLFLLHNKSSLKCQLQYYQQRYLSEYILPYYVTVRVAVDQFFALLIAISTCCVSHVWKKCSSNSSFIDDRLPSVLRLANNKSIDKQKFTVFVIYHTQNKLRRCGMTRIFIILVAATQKFSLETRLLNIVFSPKFKSWEVQSIIDYSLSQKSSYIALIN